MVEYLYKGDHLDCLLTDSDFAEVIFDHKTSSVNKLDSKFFQNLSDMKS